jgi:hypothetical protein
MIDVLLDLLYLAASGLVKEGEVKEGFPLGGMAVPDPKNEWDLRLQDDLIRPR